MLYGGVPSTLPMLPAHADASPRPWRREPLRIFFPFGVVALVTVTAAGYDAAMLDG